MLETKFDRITFSLLEAFNPSGVQVLFHGIDVILLPIVRSSRRMDCEMSLAKLKAQAIQAWLELDMRMSVS